MILALFCVLLALSLVVIALGYFTGDEPYLPVGLAFLFLLSIVIVSGRLEYQIGTEKNTTIYIYNGSNSTGGDSFLAQTEVARDDYTAWDDSTSHTVGWILSVLAFIGFVLTLFTIGKTRREFNA